MKDKTCIRTINAALVGLEHSTEKRLFTGSKEEVYLQLCVPTVYTSTKPPYVKKTAIVAFDTQE